MLLKFPHDITYWAPGTQNKFGGQTYGAPVVIKGRWEGKVENIIDANGQDAVSRAKILTESDVLPTGYLFQGVSIESDPTDVMGAYEIRIIGISPNLSNLQKLVTAYI
jgi:hypothetical protein